MLCLRFSILVILLTSLNAHAVRKFSSQQCLEAQFETRVKHDGKFFGLIKNDLIIKKDKCLLEVTFKNIFPTVWKVDICREPIHMKVTVRGSQDVYKRGSGCAAGTKSDYCGLWKELMEKVQDYGLIYAEGEREFLSHAHGQTYCTYLLLKKYLGQGVLFSSYESAPDIYGGEKEVSSPSSSPVYKKENYFQKKTQPLIEPAPVSTPEVESDQQEKGPVEVEGRF